VKWYKRIKKQAKASPPAYIIERILDLQNIRQMASVEPGNAKKALVATADLLDDHMDEEYAAELRGIAHVILDSPWRAKTMISEMIGRMSDDKADFYEGR
jgi:hypothetical protein